MSEDWTDYLTIEELNFKPIDKILDKLIGRIKQNHTNDEKVGSVNRDLAYEYQMDRVKEVNK